MDFLKFEINISLGIETVSTEIDIKNFESYGLKWNKHLNVTFILSYSN